MSSASSRALLAYCLYWFCAQIFSPNLCLMLFHKLFSNFKSFHTAWAFANFGTFTSFVAFEISDALEASEASGILKTLEVSEILQAFETFGTCWTFGAFGAFGFFRALGAIEMFGILVIVDDQRGRPELDNSRCDQSAQTLRFWGLAVRLGTRSANNHQGRREMGSSQCD